MLRFWVLGVVALTGCVSAFGAETPRGSEDPFGGPPSVQGRSTTTMIRLELVLAEVPVDEVAKQEGVSKSAPPVEKGLRPLAGTPKLNPKALLMRAELTTVENQPAQCQLGRREPRITGVTMSKAGTASQVTVENVGTTLQMRPRMEGEGAVLVEVDFQDSRVGPEEEGVVVAAPADGKPIRSPAIETLQMRTTLRIRNGETIALAGMTQQGKTAKGRVLLITAHILPPDTRPSGK